MIQSAISSSKKLLAFFNANTAGAIVNKFADRKTAERRCALLAEELQEEAFHDAQIAAAILGGAKLEHKPEQDEEPIEEMPAAVVVDHSASNTTIAALVASEPQYKAGSMRAKLAEEISTQAPIQPRAKKVDAPNAGSGRVVITVVRATFSGTSRCQVGSIRAAVLKAVQDAPDNTITVAALDAKFGHPTRGYLQKLLEKSHIECVEQQRNIEG